MRQSYELQPGILPADDIPDMQPLCFLRVGVDTDLVFGITEYGHGL